MGKGQMSIGDDTPTGEPENGPRGPYITDKDDGTRKQGPGSNKDVRKTGRTAEDSDQRRPPDNKLPSRSETEITKKSEFGSDR
ncbi:MAG: hypothetical protein QOD94_433 [Alphaproteobacteria bacterium]|nr:hypothetical protein [Alphaproteobacteria bacterium]